MEARYWSINTAATDCGNGCSIKRRSPFIEESDATKNK